MAGLVRTVVVWCPDWPVVAAAKEAGCPLEEAVAVLDRGRVYACSDAARKAGVRRGLRVREAQSRCPDLVVLAYDSAVDIRAFEPVVAVVEELAPGVEIIRPGMCAVAARGPSRYYRGGTGDGEQAFAEVLRGRLAAAGYPCDIGIADGPFAAEQAARLGVSFPAGESARCLAPLSIDVLERPELVHLLRRLGIRTLGAFAELPATQVLSRFGTDGALAHRLAAGLDHRMLATRRPPPELATGIDLEPPVDRVDQVAFAIRGAADKLVAGLAERDLVCTCLRVEVQTERDEPRGRQWRHPRWFSAADVVDRVRWQLQGGWGGDGSGNGAGSGELTSGVVKVRLTPDEVDRTGVYQDGLWGDQAPDERVHRALTRVQSMLGHEAVVTAVLSGGRAPGERVTLVPWGDEVVPARPADPPWPGHLPPPLPPTVLPTPEPVEVLDATGDAVALDERGDLSTECRSLRRGTSDAVEVVGWAGPWLVDERWWDPRTARRYARFQVTCADGTAFALLLEHDRWWIEGAYD